MTVASSNSVCGGCRSGADGAWERLGLNVRGWDYVVALAGNPNVGKSTVFNRLTGLRQHTGNWPGKTVMRAVGGFGHGGKRYKLVDLPGTYSLLSASKDEEVARDFLLFGHPDVTVLVLDATCLERNLNLALQVLQITGRVVVCLNLMDEARAHGLEIDADRLSRELGVPVIPVSARRGEGIPELIEAMARVASGDTNPQPRRLRYRSPALGDAVGRLRGMLTALYPGLPHADWVALRLLEGDERMVEAVRSGQLGQLPAEGETGPSEALAPGAVGGLAEASEDLMREAAERKWRLPADFHDRWVELLYGEAAEIAGVCVRQGRRVFRGRWQKGLDWLLTSRWTGYPIMVLILLSVLYITIRAINVPSAMLASLLIDSGHAWLRDGALGLGVPGWIVGLLIDGVYLTTAWVVSVMLPPMAVFFPIFTLLEDFGYLPRVAYNLDRLFQAVGGHGKQSLSMCMGFGCNAAGVIATRVIDSPRERLIAILTNNFALCNGRWPTQILIATIFVGGLVAPEFSSWVAASTVAGVALLGVGLTFVVSWALSRTVLRGEASTFSLELPPFRPPRIWQVLYTSLIDRTVFVLWRAIVFAAPAGAVVWLISNVHVGEVSLAAHAIDFLDPAGGWIGLNGVILLAYVVAIPANEIVIPTILMLTVMQGGLTGVGAGAGVMFETDEMSTLQDILRAGGWTLQTAVCLLLFSLCHNPCSTTIYTIFKETGSARWTAWASLMPVAVGVVLCAVVAAVWHWVT